VCCRDILTIPHAINMRMAQVNQMFAKVRGMSLLVLFFLILSLGSTAQTKTVVEGDVLVATNQAKIIAENDTLIITGTLELKQGATLTIETNAVCIIYGDLIVKNSVNLSVGAHLIVGGNVEAPSASNKVNLYVDPSAAFYILGTVSDNSTDFICDNTSNYDPPGDNSCNYGDIISLEDNENDSTGIYDLFVLGDAEKGVTPVYSELCSGSSVILSAVYESADSYELCDSTGTPISENTTGSFEVSEPGEYFVKIYDSELDQNPTISHRAKVVMNSLPAIYSAWNNDGGVICVGGAASIGASASDDVNWYAGSCSSGIMVGTGNTLSVSPDTTTVYYARAINSTTGCESDECESVTVTVIQPPTISLGTMPVIETEVGAAYIPYVSTTGNPTNYSIDFDAVSEAAGFDDHNNYKLSPDSLAINIPDGGWGITPGIYHGILTVKTYNLVECESVGYPITVTIVEATSVAGVIIAVSDTAICEGEEVVFTATPTNGGATPVYQWQIDGVDITGANSAAYISSLLTDGQAITCVMTSNLSGVTNSPATSNEITMTVNPLPTATISSTNGPVCEGDEVIFTFSGTIGAMVTYTINDGVNETVELTGGTAQKNIAIANEDQILKLISVDDGICSKNLTETTTVVVNPLPNTGDIIPD